MDKIGTIREFRTKNLRIVVDACVENDLDLSWDDTGETREGLESGKYIAFVARARAFYNGFEVASDYLGGCIYESLDAFMDHRQCAVETRRLSKQGSNAVCGSYFSDMVSNVCEQARKELCNLKSVRVRCA